MPCTLYQVINAHEKAISIKHWT